jgi:heptosyltransferase-2
MHAPSRVLVFHTAFIGDIVLTLPLVQWLRARMPRTHISFVAIPRAAEVLANHPAVDNVIVYDKKGRDAGLKGICTLAGKLRGEKFDAALVPHRSVRSAAICRLAGIPRRIGFSTSAGRFLFTDVVEYRKEAHEIARNLSLARPLGIGEPAGELPTLHPSRTDVEAVQELLSSAQKLKHGFDSARLIGVAPGSVWNTKRWPKENFVLLIRLLLQDGWCLALIGGNEDKQLCEQIHSAVEPRNRIINAAGKLTVLQSAELIHRCKVLVSNDSAPMHLAVGVRTPVVAIFGATVPAFGFAPCGKHDRVVETSGLACRPCSIHGGDVCPIKTFVCMKNILPEHVAECVRSIVETVQTEA